MPHQVLAKLSRLACAVAVALALAPAYAQVSSSGDVFPGIPGDGNFGDNTTLIIGDTTTGSVSVISGASLVGGAIFVGEAGTGIGTLSVSAAGSMVTAMNQLRVGRNGSGTLNIGSGATVSSMGSTGSSTLIAEFEGSNGSVNVDGGTFLVDRSTNSPLLGVGYRGTGALNVTNGGRVTIGSAASGVGQANGVNFYIGSSNFDSGPVTPATGTVLVSGAGSVIELLGVHGGINVGRMGAATNATLTIENGGSVYANHRLNIGRGRPNESGYGATGSVIVDGVDSLLEVKGVLQCCAASGGVGNGAFSLVGLNDGKGDLTIRNGGLVRLDARGATAESGGIAVGNDAQSVGAINIQSGGRLEILSDSATSEFGMTIGRLGSGTLNVTAGGQLLISNTGAGGVGMPFGGNASSQAGSTFSGLIAGAGTTVTLQGVNADIIVGTYAGSAGTVTVETGATVNPGNRLSVASNPGANGNLIVRGAGTTINLKTRDGDTFGAGMTIGRSGTGTATISDGAVVNVDGAGVALRLTTNVGGTGTGSGGTGTLILTGAATRYNVTGASSSLVIGRDDTGNTPSTGTLTISDGAQMNFPSNGSAGIGYSVGSSGTLEVLGPGSRLNMGAFLGVGRTFNNGAGGTGLLHVASGGVVQATTIGVGTGGTISGDGTLEGNVMNRGVIMPGNSLGTLVITGDLTLTNSSMLVLEVAGTAPGQFDRILVGGAFHADGTLKIVRSGSYIPEIADVMSVMTFVSRTGDFDNIVFEGFDAGVLLSANFSTGSLQVAAVPEPHEWLMMITGLVLVRLVGRRRRAETMRTAITVY